MSRTDSDSFRPSAASRSPLPGGWLGWAGPDRERESVSPALSVQTVRREAASPTQLERDSM